MHTTISQSSPTLADLKQVMIRIQIAALETLERCMQNLEPTGDDKKDRAQAQQLNRQRMSATQTLLHCRTMFRELREAELQEHRIAEEKRQAEKKAIFDLANLRYLHRIYPNQYDNPDAPAPSPATDNQFGEGGRASDRMRGRPEPSETSVCGMLKQRLSMSPQPPEDHAQTSLSMPHDPPKGAVVKRSAGHAVAAKPSNPSTYTPKRTRCKTRKPKHPRQSRKRKRKQRRG